MNTRIKTVIAATAISLGLSAMPASAQFFGVDRGAGYDNRTGYHDDGTLNVFGAHIDPPAARRGGILGGVGNAVGGVVGGVGSAVGGVVGGTVGAADDIVTGSLGGRADRAGYAQGYYDRPVGSGYGRSAY